MSNQDQELIYEEALMTVKEVAAYLKVSRVTAWRWCQRGIVPAFRIGGTWRIRRTDLLNLEDCLKTGKS
jgi:excisionase family DNA binding protein